MIDSSASQDIKPLKRPWLVGPNTVVILDKKLVQSLGIDENMLLQEEIVDGGILLRIVKLPIGNEIC